MPKPIRKIQVLKLVFITIPCLKFWALALDEDLPYTNSCLFTLDRLPLLLLLRKN